MFLCSLCDTYSTNPGSRLLTKSMSGERFSSTAVCGWECGLKIEATGVEDSCAASSIILTNNQITSVSLPKRRRLPVNPNLTRAPRQQDDRTTEMAVLLPFPNNWVNGPPHPLCFNPELRQADPDHPQQSHAHTLVFARPNNKIVNAEFEFSAALQLELVTKKGWKRQENFRCVVLPAGEGERREEDAHGVC